MQVIFNKQICKQTCPVTLLIDILTLIVGRGSHSGNVRLVEPAGLVAEGDARWG